ncbi:hypothetical protein [Kytococcus sp. Marseille-QA3725]
MDLTNRPSTSRCGAPSRAAVTGPPDTTAAPTSALARVSSDLLELHPWVGSPTAQAALDDATLAVLSELLGPPVEAPEPAPWTVGEHGRADLASVRASRARLRRAARALEHEGAAPHLLPALHGLADALGTFADDLTEISLRHRAASPRGDGPAAQPIGSLRAAKRLAASCRRVTEALERSDG